LESFGIAPEVIEQQVAAEVEAATFEVHPDNTQIVEVFLAFGTQWRLIGVGHGAVYQGLEYGSLQAILAGLGVARSVPDRREIFAGLRIMEAAALPLLNERAKEKPE
jgi:hypothetical protein